MATPEGFVDDIFLPGGRLCMDRFSDSAFHALREALRLARETRWDSVRSPHVFMGLLAAPDASIRNWGDRLQADLSMLLDQFQELFFQAEGEEDPVLVLNREFLSDNVIGLLREALSRAVNHERCKITPMDVLVSLLTAPQSIVAECFQRVGVTAAKLTELAVMAEQTNRENRG